MIASFLARSGAALYLFLSVVSAGIAATGPATITTHPQSQTVLQGTSATFSIVADGDQPIGYQWHRNGTVIPGATGTSYTIQYTAAGDDGAVFFATASNTLGTATSSNATLTVDPGTITSSYTNVLISMTNLWRYDQNGADLGGAWVTTNYDDSAWLSGRALLYVEDATNLPAAKNTALSLTNASGDRILTYYFRTHFENTNPPGADLSLRLSAVIDDGAVFYLNGAEVYRLGVDPNVRSVGDATAIEGPFDIPTTSLVPGDNVMAVQVRQVNNTSSDIVMGMSLQASVAIRGPDTIAPTVQRLIPTADARIRRLNEIEVQFTERVTGVDASDLLINGSPATDLLTQSPSQYLFQFPSPTNGPVTVSWVNNHGIKDGAVNPNAFGGGTWNYTIDPSAPLSDVVINEFLAVNNSSIQDEDGNSSDWIELFNSGSQIVNLDGWFLTDEANDLTKWRFPGVTIAPGEFLIVFASGKDRTNATGRLHTDFQLSSGGEYLALVLPDGTNVASEFAPGYPGQEADRSYGRDRLDLSITGYFQTPTPGQPNAIGGAGFAPPVTFSRPSGTFVSPFNLTLSTTSSNAQIRYILVTNANNSTTVAQTNIPTASSPLYTGPIPISGAVQVRARAFETGLFPGEPHSEIYIQLSGAATNFNSDLPVVVIHNFGSGAFTGINNASTFERSAYIAVFEPDKVSGRTYLTNPPTLSTRAGINLRGSSTEGFPKSSFAVELWDEFNQDVDLEVLGLPAESDWVLFAPNKYDKSLIHNPVAHELSADLDRYSSRTRMVEVFVNTTGGAVTFTAPAGGNYNGVYVLEEKVKKNKNRVDLEDLEVVHTNAPAVTGGYLLKIDRTDWNERSFVVGGVTVNYQYPDGLEMVTSAREAQRQYITNYFLQFVNALNGSSYTNPTTGYAAYIDVDAWIDHHLLNTLTFNVDALRLSGYFFKDREKKIEMGPIWDFDRAMGTMPAAGDDDRPFNPRTWRSRTGDGGTDFFNYPWWARLFTAPDFFQRYIDRYQELRQTAFDTNHIADIIDSLGNEVREAQVREDVRWNTGGNSNTRARGGSLTADGFSYTFPGTYQGELDFMKTWFAHRVHFMDTNFLDMPVLSHPGGQVEPGHPVTISGPTKQGTVLYYTLNGTDPRASGGGISPSALQYTPGTTLYVSNNTRIVVRSFNATHANLTGANNPPIVSRWSGPAAATYYINLPPLRITEIMYHPANAPAGDTNSDENFEYVEVTNIGNTPLNVNRFTLSGGVQFSFPNTLLTAGESAVIVANQAAFQSRYGNGPRILGVYSNRLANSSDRLILEGGVKEPIHNFKYSDEWYPITDGFGFSLVSVDPAGSLSQWGMPQQWRPSGALGGSPGATDIPANIPVIVINEALTHTDPQPPYDTVELKNLSGGSVNLGGWFLTDEFDTPKKYRIPDNTFIAANSFALFDELDFFHNNTTGTPFSLSSLGDAIYLFSGDANTNLTGYYHGFDYGPAANGTTFGRHIISTGADQFPLQSSPTLGGENSGPKVGPVVISEIMYHPPDLVYPRVIEDNAEDEYIELKNISSSPVSLFHPVYPTNTWRLTDAVEYEFPENVTMPGNGILLIVSFDPADTNRLNGFLSRNGVPPGTPVYGPWSGKLDNSSESIELRQPDNPEPEGPPSFGLVPYVLVERARYSDDLPWPVAADGAGGALQRVLPAGYGNDPASWRAGSRGTPGTDYSGGTAPTISSHPTNQNIVAFNQVSFSVTASGPGPLTYQWRFNGDPLAGATNPTLVISNAQPSHAGYYQALVMNPSSSVLSSNAELIVRVGLRITQQPRSLRVPPGTNVSFSVVATSSRALSYQWRYNGADIPGATSPIYTINNVTNVHEGAYTVVVTDSIGSVHSVPATLTLLFAPILVSPVPPLLISAVPGETLTLGVEVFGTYPIFNRWRLFRQSGGSILQDENLFQPFSYYTFTVASNSAGAYTVILTNELTNVQRARTNAILTILTDTDKDKIPDTYEDANGMDKNSVDDADADNDGDTMSNRAEYIAGTNPLDPESYLKIEMLPSGVTGSIKFGTVSNRTYSIMYKDDLSLPGWTNRLADIQARATNRVEIIIDPAPASNRYYRVVTPRQP